MSSTDVRPADNEDQLLETFTRWWNYYCAPICRTRIADLKQAVTDGYLPIVLIEMLERREAGKNSKMAVKTPRTVYHRTNNLELFLTTLKEYRHDWCTYGVGELGKGETEVLIGLTWELVRRYELAIHAIGLDGGASDIFAVGEAALLEWVNEQCFAIDGVKMKALSAAEGDGSRLPAWRLGFSDGRALCKVLAAQIPDSLDIAEAEALASSEERLELAFETAEELIRVPRLIDVAELAQGSADSRAVLLYVAMLKSRIMNAVPPVLAPNPLQPQPSNASSVASADGGASPGAAPSESSPKTPRRSLLPSPFKRSASSLVGSAPGSATEAASPRSKRKSSGRGSGRLSLSRSSSSIKRGAPSGAEPPKGDTPSSAAAAMLQENEASGLVDMSDLQMFDMSEIESALAAADAKAAEEAAAEAKAGAEAKVKAEAEAKAKAEAAAERAAAREQAMAAAEAKAAADKVAAAERAAEEATAKAKAAARAKAEAQAKAEAELRADAQARAEAEAMVAAQARAKADAEAAARAQAKAKDAEQAKKSFAKSSNRLPPPPEDDARPTLDGLLGDSESFVGGRGVEFRLSSDEISSAAEPPPAKCPEPKRLATVRQFSSAGSVGGSLDHHHSRPSLLHSESSADGQPDERTSFDLLLLFALKLSLAVVLWTVGKYLGLRTTHFAGAALACGVAAAAFHFATAKEDEPPPPPLHEMHHIHLPASRATHVPPPPPPGPAPDHDTPKHDVAASPRKSLPVRVAVAAVRASHDWLTVALPHRVSKAPPPPPPPPSHDVALPNRVSKPPPPPPPPKSPASAALAPLAEHSAEGSLDHHHSRPALLHSSSSDEGHAHHHSRPHLLHSESSDDGAHHHAHGITGFVTGRSLQLSLLLCALVAASIAALWARGAPADAAAAQAEVEEAAISKRKGFGLSLLLMLVTLAVISSLFPGLFSEEDSRPRRGRGRGASPARNRRGNSPGRSGASPKRAKSPAHKWRRRESIPRLRRDGTLYNEDGLPM